MSTTQDQESIGAIATNLSDDFLDGLGDVLDVISDQPSATSYRAVDTSG